MDFFSNFFCLINKNIRTFSFPTGGFGENVIIFEKKVSEKMRKNVKISVHVDNKKKNVLIFGEGPTQGLDDTILTAEK